MSTQGRGPGRIWAAMMAVVTVALVCACTPDPIPIEPEATGSPSPTPATTATPTPTPTVPGEIAALPEGVKPERPAAIDGEPTLDGAIALAVYYQQLQTYAQQVGSLDDVTPLGHPDCVYCASMTDAIGTMIDRGERLTGGGVTITDASGTEVDLGRWFAVRFTLVEEPSQEVNEFGTVVDDAPERKTYTMDVAVVYENSNWAIREVSYEVTAREIPAEPKP